MRILRHPSGLTQRLTVADLTRGGVEAFSSMVESAQAPVEIVYSDPPWSPGNEKWWRRHAGAAPPASYLELLDAWCECATMASPSHIFCEQSINDDHRRFLIDAVDRSEGWSLPLIEQWFVRYGSPLRPNVLLHWGMEPLATNPSNMHGEAMTRCVFEGLRLHGCTVADPCTGLGMTSRMAHRFGLHFIGTELNSARLERTVGWLLRNGYTEGGR